MPLLLESNVPFFPGWPIIKQMKTFRTYLLFDRIFTVFTLKLTCFHRIFTVLVSYVPYFPTYWPSTIAFFSLRSRLVVLQASDSLCRDGAVKETQSERSCDEPQQTVWGSFISRSMKSTKSSTPGTASTAPQAWNAASEKSTARPTFATCVPQPCMKYAQHQRASVFANLRARVADRPSSRIIIKISY